MIEAEVVLLHHEHWPDVRMTLDALLDQVPADRVLVVDNGSRDGSSKKLRNAYPTCRHIQRAPIGNGYAQGMNAGIDATSADRVLVMAHDCVLGPNGVRTLEARLDEAREVGIVGPLLVLTDDPDLVWSEGGGVCRGQPRRLHGGELAVDRLGGPPRTVGWVDGTCMMIRRRVFDDVRFDEGYFLYFEDVEICLAAAAKGWVVECVAACAARTSPGVGPTALALWTRNRLRFAWRNARPSFLRELTRVVRHAGGCTCASRLRRRGVISLLTRESPEKLYGLRT